MVNPIKALPGIALAGFLITGGLSSCRDGKRYHEEPETAAAEVSEVPPGGLGAILKFQDELNTEFRDPEQSPLPRNLIQSFAGLAFFEPDTAYQVMARLVRTPEALPFEMPTTTERMSTERKYGNLQFELMGNTYTLEVYQSPELLMEEGFEDYLFLPFTDATNGEETYEGGRYMDLRIPRGDSILLDFNTAYNPYCAYNPKYSCPLVPSVNNLDIPVRAGVKAYRK
ncbi:DUF1684 domain-containing protein [Robiginitalea sp. SC105]|uniref:DUF1684 domain-containing protein n=1 Tax=Robiginitalea sp. SC105 TaxID=2762332 RepID=UPI00163B37B5|nr:DUF1684 domain-containing protein [Robiginitalea sp. SC105]MBC2839889.1 DUF1684 domain-containing protein [Robiginitalea sp. SC105]